MESSNKTFCGIKNISNEEICRICATKDDSLIPIFEEESLEKGLCDKINLFLPITVSFDDEFSHLICCQCTSHIIAWSDLHKRAMRTDEYLRNILKQNEKGRDEHEEVYLEKYSNQIDENLEKKRDKSTPYIHLDLKNLRHSTRKKSVSEKRKSTEVNLLAHCNFTCLFCKDKSYFTKTEQRQHIIDCHADLVFHCDICDNYLDRKVLIPHMSTHASQQTRVPVMSNKSIQCAASKISIVTKLSRRDKASSEVINKCSKQAKFIKDSKKNKILSDIYKCKSCDKIYDNYSGMYYHIKHVHQGIKLHKCSICDKSFKLQSHLRDHIQIHSEETPFKCPECDKGFKRHSSLYIHRKIHSNELEFSCSHNCGKRFKTKQQAMKHSARHLGKKNFVCQICKKDFIEKSDLTRHSKTHQSSERHKCLLCEGLFSQKRYLKDHLKYKHLEKV